MAVYVSSNGDFVHVDNDCDASWYCYWILKIDATDVIFLEKSVTWGKD